MLKKILRALVDTIHAWSRVLIILALAILVAGLFSGSAAFQFSNIRLNIPGLIVIVLGMAMIVFGPAIAKRAPKPQQAFTASVMKITGTAVCAIGALVMING